MKKHNEEKLSKNLRELQDMRRRFSVVFPKHSLLKSAGTFYNLPCLCVNIILEVL